LTIVAPAAGLRDVNGGNSQSTGRWSPQYVRPRLPARRVLRHQSLAVTGGHLPSPAARARPGAGGGEAADADSSTDGDYTALEVQLPRRRRCPVTSAALRRPHRADDDHQDDDDDDDDD